MIRSMKVDHAKLASKVTAIDSETKKNSSDIKMLNENLEESNKNVKELFRLSREFRQEMDELSEKVAELHLLKKQIGVSLDAEFVHHCMNLLYYMIIADKSDRSKRNS